MVQVSLKKVGCLVGFLLLAFLLWTFVAQFADIGRHVHAATVRMLPAPQDVAELRRMSPPSRVPLDPVQKAELRRIYAEIVQAYSNRQVEVLREWRRKLPELVERVGQDDFDDAKRPFSRIFFDEVIPKLGRRQEDQSILSEYSGVEDFERIVATVLAFAGIYGDVRLRRREFGGRFNDIEMLVVYRLKTYRDCFRTAGRTDMEKVADRFLSEWINQIESENGYTRALLIHYLARDRVGASKIMENHGQTWDEISQNSVRQATHGLIRAGYTPKWIEEFKVIPRHVTPREGVPQK